LPEIKSYRDLEVWQRGIQVTKEVYLLTRRLPKDDRYGLSIQMRRSAVSIPSNIAEGHAQTTQQFKRHLAIAMGSLAELETQLILSADLYPETGDAARKLLAQLDALNRKLRTLVQRLS